MVDSSFGIGKAIELNNYKTMKINNLDVKSWVLQAGYPLETQYSLVRAF